MTPKTKPRRRKWWLPYLQTLLGILFIIGCYFLWGSYGTGSGTGTGSGFGSGTGSGTGSGKGAGHGAGQGNGSQPGRNPAPAPKKPKKPASSPGSTTAQTPTPGKPAVPDPGSSAVPPPKQPQARPLLASENDAGSASGEPAFSGGGGGGSGRFYGLKIARSENVLFLVDVSNSMRDRTSEGLTRLEALKKELIRAVQPPPGQPANQGTFFIVAYGSQPAMVPPGRKLPFHFNRPADVAEAIRAINALDHNGGTEMTAAWKSVLPRVRVFDVRRVYFLTDGEPTDGFTAARFREMQRASGAKFRVECIAIGVDSALLREIARLSGGRYLVVH